MDRLGIGSVVIDFNMKRFGIVKGKRETYALIGLALTLIIIIFSIVIILLRSTETSITTQDTDIVRTPTRVQAPQPTSQPAFTNPPVPYDVDAQNALLDKKINRRQLSPTDRQLKREILALLPEGQIAGIVHESNTVRIEYIESLDLFKVEILTINVAQAKDEGDVWFKAQGMSQQGICDLPLGYYLNWEVANQLRDTNFVFNPLPKGCE